MEDETERSARTLRGVLHALGATEEQAANLARAQAAFSAAKLAELEPRWRSYITNLVETPGEVPYRQGRMMLNQKDYASALSLLNDAAEKDTEYERIFYFRACAYYYTGLAPAAEKDLTQALALFPEYHAARFLRGKSRAAQGNKAGAQADFEACLKTPYKDNAKKELDALK
jgi:tetratricopeptide (TPR) repeat protein